MVDYLTAQEFSEDMQLGIDKAISLAQDATADYIEVANTERHRWAAGQPLLLENEDGYQETAIISSVVYGTGSTDTKINLSSSLSDETKFTTAKSSNVRINQFFTALTTPSSTTIERWILEAEIQIDNWTYRSWKASTWEGYIPYDPKVIRAGWGERSERYSMKLPVVDIRTPLSSDSGDSLKTWTGTTEQERLGSWTEGRGENYWIDSTGWLFFLHWRPRASRRSVWLKCRYGETAVPYDIQNATSQLVKRKLIRGGAWNTQVEAKPTDGESWPYQQGAPTWAEIKGLLRPYRRDVIGAV